MTMASRENDAGGVLKDLGKPLEPLVLQGGGHTRGIASGRQPQRTISKCASMDQPHEAQGKPLEVIWVFSWCQPPGGGGEVAGMQREAGKLHS